MIYGLIVLASHFKSGNFVMDVVAPAVAGVIVLLLIGNSLLGHFGYKLW
jgi:hypothetical protein